MSQPLRAGVVGLGWAGQQHMAAYAELPDVQLVAIAGMEIDQLQRLGQQYDTGQYASWQDLLAGAELDVVSIATPTSLHAPIAVAALEAGIHVLSEKPIAENASAARTMVAAAKANDRVLEVSFNHRRRGDVAALKSVLDAQLLGRIYYAKAGWVRRQGIPGLDSWFTRAELAGGGPLMDIGVHMLDMALYLLGEPAVTAVTAATYAEFGPRGKGGATSALAGKTTAGGGSFDVEDLSTAFLRLADGVTLLLETSWAQWIESDSCYLTLSGTDGGARLEWGGGPGSSSSLKIWTEVAGIPAELEPSVPAHGGHRACVQDFLAEVRSGDQRYRGDEALARAVVVDACYASARTRREVDLSYTQ